MKAIYKVFAAAALALAVALPSQAQIRFGVKAGVAINELHFNENALKENNRAGFTGGIMAEFTMPIVGLGVDASVLYANRSFESTYVDPDTPNSPDVFKKTRSYIDIPVNAKWKIGIPGVNNLVTPFITTGPDFSFLISKENIEEGVKNKKFDMAWNVGIGVELISKIQIAGSYGFPLTNSVSGNNALYKGKNRCWTITAAYMF